MSNDDVKSMLAQFSTMDLSTLDEVIDDGKRTASAEVYKIQEGRTELRLMPPPRDEVASGRQKAPWIVRWQHFLMLDGMREGRAVVDCPRMNLGKPCAVCRAATTFSASEALADQQVGDKIKVNKSFLAYARIKSQPKGRPPQGVVPVTFGARVFDGIVSLLDELKRQGAGDALSNVMRGRDLVVRRDDKNNYSVALGATDTRAFESGEVLTEQMGQIVANPLSMRVGNMSEKFIEEALGRFYAGAKIRLPEPTRIGITAGSTRGLPKGSPVHDGELMADAGADADPFGDDEF